MAEQNARFPRLSPPIASNTRVSVWRCTCLRLAWVEAGRIRMTRASPFVTPREGGRELLAIAAKHCVLTTLPKSSQLAPHSSGAVAQAACYAPLAEKKKRDSPEWFPKDHHHCLYCTRRPLPPSRPPSQLDRVRAQWSRKNGLFALKSEAAIF